MSTTNIITKDLIDRVVNEEPRIIPFVFKNPYLITEYQVPTFRNNCKNEESVYRCDSLEEFKGNLTYYTHSDGKSIPSDFNDLFIPIYEDSTIILAGGSVMSLIRGDSTIADFDFFVVARDVDRARKEVLRMCKRFYFMGSNFTVTRSKNAITFYAPSLSSKPLTIQLILLSAPTALEIIKDFDLGSSQVFYDGKNVYTTL